MTVAVTTKRDLTSAPVMHEDIRHDTAGTRWGSLGAATYASTRHGPDGSRLLDPYFLPALLQGIPGQIVADIGCGAGPWAIEAAKAGAVRVDASDIQAAMIEKAREAVKNANVQDRVFLKIEDAQNLTLPTRYYDKALSINVGCNLPSGVFESHFRELFRVLKQGGVAIITAPDSFDTLFTDGKAERSLLIEDLQRKLNALPNHPNGPEIVAALSGFDHIYRATFVMKNERLCLVTDEKKELTSGCEIWRKLPSLVVPNRYHSNAEYHHALESAGLKITKYYAPKAENKNILATRGLGEEYCKTNAFAIFIAEKQL